MNDVGNMNNDFFAIVWLIIFGVIIVTVIWLLQAKKARTKKSIAAAKERFEKGDISKEEYEALLKKIRES